MGAGYRYAEIKRGGGGAGFEIISARKSGVSFANVVPDEALVENRHLVNGSGVTTGDVDGDGWTDLFFASMLAESKLYRNIGGWRFEDITDLSGLGAGGRYTTGTAFVDYDGDGDLDLLVTSLVDGIRAYVNDGTGRFSDASGGGGVGGAGASTSLALADIDGDRDLDLYAAFYKRTTLKDILPPSERSFEKIVIPTDSGYSINPVYVEHYRLERQGSRLMRMELGEPDRLYRNTGNGRFALVADTDNVFRGERGGVDIAKVKEWGLTARFQDFNGDGLPDLYVCNDFESPDQFWFGDGRGRFTDVSSLAVRKTSQSTMSVAAADVNGDGVTDLFLADMLSRSHARRQRQYQTVPPERVEIGKIDVRLQVSHNTLLMGRGDGTYAETARASGVEASEWTWASVFLDVDLDGDEDLIVTTGHAYDAMDADMQVNASRDRNWRRSLLRYPALDLPNMAFENVGNSVFEPVEAGWGLGYEADVSHGMALADFDNDGDLDVAINRLNKTAGLYRNNVSKPRIAVRLRGIAPNTRGIGARIRVIAEGAATQEKEMVAGGMYLSSSDAIQTFAALQQFVLIEVLWRSGLISVVDSALVDHIYEIDEAFAERVSNNASAVRPVFELVYEGAPHREPAYEDFRRQPLLPWMLSQRGPALVVADVDGDGDEDIVQGSGRGGRIQAVVNDGGHFNRIIRIGAAAKDDQAGIVFVGSGVGGRLLVATGNYENPSDSGQSGLTAYDLAADVSETLLVGKGAIGSLVAAHFDKDAMLDLFVGTHFLPGHFPLAPPSSLFRGSIDSFEKIGSVDAAGPVSSAVAGDLDMDGDQDLVLAVHWGPIRVLMNKGNGQLVDESARLGLSEYTGLWNGVALGDFDSDGRLDIAATNWGWNSRYGPPQSRDRAIRLYHGDVDDNRTWDIFESRYDRTIGGYVPTRDLRTLLNAVPPIARRVRSHHEFARLTLQELLGSASDTLSVREAHVLSSTVFLNRENGFEAVTLPREAQLSPAFSVSVADMNGDGAEDLFLGQNLFALPAEVSRQDAGRGLWLRGNGKGAFKAVPAPLSGMQTYGQQRGAVVGDFDQDGRVDIAVTQNGNKLHVYRNVNAKPGLRVRLPVPAGVGATVRIKYSDGSLGPVRVFSAGSGFYSQDSSELVLGVSSTPHSVLVRWPQGGEEEVPIAPGAAAVTLE